MSPINYDPRGARARALRARHVELMRIGARARTRIDLGAIGYGSIVAIVMMAAFVCGAMIQGAAL